MSTDEMTDTEAHELLGRALDAEPMVHLRPESVLGLARSSRARRRMAVTGGMAMALAAITVGTTVLAGPSGGTPTAAGGPPIPTPSEVNGTGGMGPPVLDERSRRLTDVLAAAHLIPPGLRVEQDPGRDEDPLVFGTYVLPLTPKPTIIDMHPAYDTGARLADDRGYGDLEIGVSADAWSMFLPGGSTYQPHSPNCARVESGVSCQERTLPGGIKATAATKHDSHGQTVWVYAERTNGTYVVITVSNYGKPTPSRDELPLDVETLFKIAGLPGLEY
jgi:hypothetical protein